MLKRFNGSGVLRSEANPGGLMAELLTLDTLKIAAREYSAVLAYAGVEALYGLTDGKAVGTYVEAGF